MLHGVAHPVVAASGLAAGAERYAALLGCAPEPRATDARETLFRLANADLVLRPAEESEGLVALCFAAADPDACAEALAGRGISVEPHAAGRGFDLPRAATRGLPLACIEAPHRAPSAEPAARTSPSSPQAPRSGPRSEAKPSAPQNRRPPQAPRSGARSEAKPSEVIALDHVVIASSDLEASRRLYADLLGLRLALDRSFEARGLRILFFRVGGVTVEVVGRLDASGDPQGGDRFGGLAWRVGDTDAARERVAQGGFDVSPVRAGAKPGTRVCTVRSGTCGVPTLLIGPGLAGPRAR